MRIAWLFLASALAALAQSSAEMSGPSLGYTPDGSRVRPMYGLPGAGAVGDPVNIGRELAEITAAPNYALAIAADNGQALMIAGGAAAVLNGTAPGASEIAVSPAGASAALWFLNGHFEIVTGMPSSPAVRDLDASFLTGAPASIAVSDDGQSVVGVWENGAFIFHSNGAAAIPLNGIEAVAFLPNQNRMVAATADGISEIDGGAVTDLYHVTGNRRTEARDAAVGIGASADDRYVVAADRAGEVVTVDLTAGTSSITRCGCAPEGVFPLGGTLFRLTGAAHQVNVFDASENAVLVIPPALAAASSTLPAPAITASASLPALPAVTIGGIPSSTGYKQQPSMTISIASAYPVTITGTVTLTFASSVGGDDQTIQFVSPTTGRTAPFTIPAGSTTASFSGNANLSFETGTVAGTITLTLDFTASGSDITPTPAPSKTYTTNPTVPSISLVTLEQTPGGVTVLVTGFASPRSVTSGTFNFAAATGTSISNPTLTVDLSSAFNTWYSNSASNAYGSEFTLTMPFPVQGQAGDVVSVTVTLSNAQGTSGAVTLSQ